MLFIDEAHDLHRVENERDYGQEPIEMLLQIMENERENVVRRLGRRGRTRRDHDRETLIGR